MSRVLNLRYKGNNVTDTEIIVVRSYINGTYGAFSQENYFVPKYYIDIHSDIISTTFGIMVKELTYMSALENFEEDVVDDFINDIHEIDSLRRWLWEEKLVSSPNPAPGFRSNTFWTSDDANDYEHKEIYSYARKLLEKFVKKWSKYFDKLSINED